MFPARNGCGLEILHMEYVGCCGRRVWQNSGCRGTNLSAENKGHEFHFPCARRWDELYGISRCRFAHGPKANFRGLKPFDWEFFSGQAVELVPFPVAPYGRRDRALIGQLLTMSGRKV